MRHDPLFLVWTVNCPSSEDCRKLQRWLHEEITPDAVFVDEVRNFKAGLEAKSREPHRLRDYFERVQVFPSSEPTNTSFRVLFHRRPTARRFWKDLMATILHKVRAEAVHTTTKLDYQGDQEPEIPAALP